MELKLTRKHENKWLLNKLVWFLKAPGTIEKEKKQTNKMLSYLYQV